MGDPNIWAGIAAGGGAPGVLQARTELARQAKSDQAALRLMQAEAQLRLENEAKKRQFPLTPEELQKIATEKAQEELYREQAGFYQRGGAPGAKASAEADLLDRLRNKGKPGTPGKPGGTEGAPGGPAIEGPWTRFLNLLTGGIAFPLGGSVPVGTGKGEKFDFKPQWPFEFQGKALYQGLEGLARMDPLHLGDLFGLAQRGFGALRDSNRPVPGGGGPAQKRPLRPPQIPKPSREEPTLGDLIQENPSILRAMMQQGLIDDLVFDQSTDSGGRPIHLPALRQDAGENRQQLRR